MVIPEQNSDLSLETIQDIITKFQHSKFIKKILDRDIPYNKVLRSDGDRDIVSIHVSWKGLFESIFTINSKMVAEAPIKMYEALGSMVRVKRVSGRELSFFIEYRIIKPSFKENSIDDKNNTIKAHYIYALDSLGQFSLPAWRGVSIQEKFAIILEELHQSNESRGSAIQLSGPNPQLVTSRLKRNPFYDKLSEALMAWYSEMGEVDRERIGMQDCEKVLLNTDDYEVLIKVAIVFLNSFHTSFRSLL